MEDAFDEISTSGLAESHLDVWTTDADAYAVRIMVRNDELGLGGRCGSSFGEAGVTKRLSALAELEPLRGARLLDVGCGSGVYTERLAEGFDQIDAVDIEPERLNDFRARISGTSLADKIEIHDGDAAALAFPDETFDIVTAIEVLEHVPDLDRTIGEVRRVLRKGGHFLVTTPNRWFPFETHGVLVRGRRLPPSRAPFVTWVPPVHRRVADARVFTRRSLREHLERNGFRVDDSRYMFPPFDRSALGQRIRPVTDRMEQTPFRVFGMTHIVSTTRL